MYYKRLTFRVVLPRKIEQVFILCRSLRLLIFKSRHNLFSFFFFFRHRSLSPSLLLSLCILALSSGRFFLTSPPANNIFVLNNFPPFSFPNSFPTSQICQKIESAVMFRGIDASFMENEMYRMYFDSSLYSYKATSSRF